MSKYIFCFLRRVEYYLQPNILDLYFIFQERRITPSEALNHPFLTMAHMADYAHCSNVKSSAQKMEICKRTPVAPPPHTAATLMAAGVRSGNVTLTFNNQLAGRVGAAAQVNRTFI